MTDREMVIKGLKCCQSEPPATRRCDECPYDGVSARCDMVLHKNALELLEHQEPIKPITVTTNLKEWGVPDEKITAEAIKKWTFHSCGNCKATLLRTDNYCSKCGRKVKWDD